MCEVSYSWNQISPQEILPIICLPIIISSLLTHKPTQKKDAKFNYNNYYVNNVGKPSSGLPNALRACKAV